MVLNKIKEFLKDDPENKELELKNIQEVFREEKTKEIDKNQKEVQKLKKKLSNSFEELKESLNFLQDFKDEKGRQRFEDVAQNINQKTEDIQKVNSKNPEEIEDFLNQMALDRKEMAVLDRLGKDGKTLLNKIRRTQHYLGKIEDKRENSPERKLQEIQTHVEKVEKLEDDKKELQEEKKELKLNETREKLQEKEKELEKFYETNKWRQKEELENKIDQKESKIEEIEKNVSETVSSVKRPLKKVEYNSTKSLADFASKLKDNQWKQIENFDEMTDQVEKRIQEVCSTKQINRFQQKTREIKEIPSKIHEIKNLEREIEQHKQKLGNLDLAREKEIKNKIRQLERKLDKQKNEQEELETKIHSKETQIQDELKKLENILNTELYDNYTVIKGS